MVQERAEAKKVRDYSRADDIRDRLMNEFDVAVDDKIKLWSMGGDFGFGKRVPKGPYEQADTSEEVNDEVSIYLTLRVEI